MKNIILFDDDAWQGLLPLCYTRPIAELRVGILTIREKWEKHLGGKGSFITQDYLAGKFPIDISDDNIVINSRFLPSQELVSLVRQLDYNDALLYGERLIAARMNADQFTRLVDNKQIDELEGVDLINEDKAVRYILNPYDIFSFNEYEIQKDFRLLTKNRLSAALPGGVRVSGNADKNIFVEEGAVIKDCFINCEEGPVYIASDAVIMEGAMIRGPFALCNHAQVKMGAKIYGATTVGPHSKVGGELNNVVIQAYSNKAHDGFLGNSVIGEWCNIGADSNSSNLKNNYADVKVWSYETSGFQESGLQFCGLIMADHSKAGINTMFNTGTVVGMSCNLFGSGFPRNFIPSFAWGGAKGYKTFKPEKAMELAAKVMLRRGVEFSDEDRIIFEHVFHQSAQFRHWES